MADLGSRPSERPLKRNDDPRPVHVKPAGDSGAIRWQSVRSSQWSRSRSGISIDMECCALQTYANDCRYKSSIFEQFGKGVTAQICEVADTSWRQILSGSSLSVLSTIRLHVTSFNEWAYSPQMPSSGRLGPQVRLFRASPRAKGIYHRRWSRWPTIQ
jgi:hypothetical protein